MPSSTPKPDRANLSVTIKKDLADRLDKEADARMVGKGLLVEKAIESFLDRLQPLDLAEAKAAPTPPAAAPTPPAK